MPLSNPRASRCPQGLPGEDPRTPSRHGFAYSDLEFLYTFHFFCTLAQCTKIGHSDGDLLHAAQGKPFLELFFPEECTDYPALGTL